MNARRPLSKSELDLWRRATADVEPLADLPKSEPPSPKPSQMKPALPNGNEKPPRRTGGKGESPPSPAAPRALDPARPIDIDRRSWARLKRGQIDIERTLDLHGRTQAEAHSALSRFLDMASATGLRCILVVTGKGGADGRGVLRQMVPRWLAEASQRQTVLTYCPAQPRHGGDGALYVLLKRRRQGAGR